jgi:hypothetical protein
MNKNLSYIMLNVLGQVIKLCLRHGIKYQHLIELTKTAYITEAHRILETETKEPSISRLSVMTGIHRKDISKHTTGQKTQRKKPNILSRIITDWQHHPKFSLKNKPKALNIKGRNSEFAELVDFISNGDLDPYTALFELERIGAVQVDKEKNVVNLIWKEFAPETNEIEALEMLAEDSKDLHEAILANINKDEDEISNLHLKTEYTRIPEAVIPKLKKWLLEQGSAFHQNIRSELAKYDLDLKDKEACEDKEYRIAVGTFSITEKQETKQNNKKR